jgi:hypothetical protein
MTRLEKAWDALDVAGCWAILILLGIIIYSFYLNVSTFGIDGLVIGRLFSSKPPGGFHTLSVFVLFFPFAWWGFKRGVNKMITLTAIMGAVWYHEALWNISYNIYYHQPLMEIGYATSLAALCAVFFCVFLLLKPSIKPILYILPWFGLTTAYAFLVHAYTENQFGVSYYYSFPLGLYEICEVGLFAFLLWLAIRNEKLNKIVYSKL